ncbi:MAG: hypothetical protein ACOC24_07475 [Desulfovibrionales bacterium]
MKTILSIACMILLLTPGLASAQETWGFNPGDWSFTLQGSGSSDNDVDNTNLSIETSVGYFYTEAFEVGVRQGIGFADIEGGDDNWNGSTRAYADFNFPLGQFVPFLGANLGYLYGDDVNETWIAGPEGGLKYFLKPDTFLAATVEYNFTFEDADEADDAFDDGRFVYALGFGVTF